MAAARLVLRVRVLASRSLTTTRTSTAPLFRQSAEELVHRLGDDPSAIARALVAEAQELMNVFTQWEKDRPTDETRVARIHQLFELNKKVMDHLATRAVPSSPPSARRFGH